MSSPSQDQFRPHSAASGGHIGHEGHSRSSSPAACRVRAADSVFHHAAKAIEFEDVEGGCQLWRRWPTNRITNRIRKVIAIEGQYHCTIKPSGRTALPQAAVAVFRYGLAKTASRQCRGQEAYRHGQFPNYAEPSDRMVRIRRTPCSTTGCHPCTRAGSGL